MQETIVIRPSETANAVAIPSHAWETLPEELARQGIKGVKVYKGVKALKAFGVDAYQIFSKELEEVGYCGPCFVVEAYGDADDMHRLACAMYEPEPVEPEPEATPYDEADAMYLAFSDVERDITDSLSEGCEKGAELARRELLAMWPEAIDAMDAGIKYCAEIGDRVKQASLEQCRDGMVYDMRVVFPDMDLNGVGK